MKVKVSELSGSALDWAVAKAEGFNMDKFYRNYNTIQFLEYSSLNYSIGDTYHPSTIWDQGGPIIERENISVCPGDWDLDSDPVVKNWFALNIKDNVNMDEHKGTYGSTPLIAAMRCYVESKLGNEIEIPD